MMQVRGRNVGKNFEKLQENETPLGMMSVWEASTSVAVNQKIVENYKLRTVKRVTFDNVVSLPSSQDQYKKKIIRKLSRIDKPHF